GVSNQTERIGVDPALVLAASEPSARDLASPRTVSAAYDPEIRTLANRRSQTECLTCIFAGLRRRRCTAQSENTNQREKTCDLGHCWPRASEARTGVELRPKKADADPCHRFRFADRWPVKNRVAASIYRMSLCCRSQGKGGRRVTAWTVAAVGDRRPRSSRVLLPPCAPPRRRPASYTVRRAHNRTSRYSAHAQGRAGTGPPHRRVDRPASTRPRAIDAPDNTSTAAPCRGASPAMPPPARIARSPYWHRLAPARRGLRSRSAQA